MLFGFAIVVGLILLAMLAPALAPYGANERLLDNILQRPNAAHIFGTDMQGRDILSRVIHGSRISLGVAFPAVALAILVGAPVGLMAGYFGGLLDLIVMRVFEILFGFPAILLAVSIVAVMGPSLPNLVLTIALLYIPSIAMVVRAPTLSLKNQEFVTAATMVGARHGRILVRHILPNVAAPIVVQASLLLSTALLTEAALSFLGIGAQPPTPSWGADLGRGRQYMLLGPWQVIFPGAAIMVAVLGFNLLGDALRDFFDPRIRTRL
jgi:peptide/nickel transport system permease protein